MPFAFAKRFGVVILDQSPTARVLTVACKTHPSLTTLAEIKRFARKQIKLRLVPEDEFESLLTSTYARDSSEARQMVEDMGDELDLMSLAQSVPETEDLLEQEDDAPIIRLINALLAEAIRENASDIHIETFERELVVRFRVDGVMREVVKPKRELAPLLVSRIKVMGRLDIAEKRIPQDGRISLRIGGREVDGTGLHDARQQRRARGHAPARQTGWPPAPGRSRYGTRQPRPDSLGGRQAAWHFPGHGPHGLG